MALRRYGRESFWAVPLSFSILVKLIYKKYIIMFTLSQKN